MKNFNIYKFQFKNLIRNTTLIIFSAISVAVTALLALLIAVAPTKMASFYINSFGLKFTFKSVLQIIFVGLFEVFVVYFLFFKQFSDGLVKIEIRAKVKYQNIFFQRLLLNKTFSLMLISTMLLLDVIITSPFIKSADQLIVNRLIYFYVFLIVFDIFITGFILLVLTIANQPLFFVINTFMILIIALGSSINSLSYSKSIKLTNENNIGKSDVAMKQATSGFEGKYVKGFYDVLEESGNVDKLFNQYTTYTSQDNFIADKDLVIFNINENNEIMEIIDVISDLFKNDETYKITQSKSKKLDFMPMVPGSDFNFQKFYKFKLDNSLIALNKLAKSSNDERVKNYLPIFDYLAVNSYPTMKALMIVGEQSSRITTPFFRPDQNLLIENIMMLKKILNTSITIFAAYLSSYIVLSYMRAVYAVSYDVIFTDYVLENKILEPIKNNLYFSPFSHISSMTTTAGKNKFIVDLTGAYSNTLNFNYINQSKEVLFKKDATDNVKNLWAKKEHEENKLQVQTDFSDTDNVKSYYQLIENTKYTKIIQVWGLYFFYIFIAIALFGGSFLLMKRIVYI